MIIPYRQRVYKKHPNDPELVIYEPIIPIEVSSPTGDIQFDALADTGSDITVFPSLGASKAHLSSTKSKLVDINQGNTDITKGKDIWLKMIIEGEVYEWTCDVWFSNEPNSKPTLGHIGFFEFFTATFQGKENQLILKPNSEFPGKKINLWK